MRFEAKVEANGNGGYLASCPDPQCTASGLSATDALEALREEIRFRLELCPCTGLKDTFVELDVASQS